MDLFSTSLFLYELYFQVFFAIIISLDNRDLCLHHVYNQRSFIQILQTILHDVSD